MFSRPCWAFGYYLYLPVVPVRGRSRRARRVKVNHTPGSSPPESGERNPGEYGTKVLTLVTFVNPVCSSNDACPDRSTGACPLVAQFVTDLHLPLSQIRLEGYRPRNGSDLDMVTNYFWNIDLAEALVPALHAAELALRNGMHAGMTASRGTDMWFYEPGLLEGGQLGDFARALAKVSKRGSATSGRIVAELTFGFWVSMLNAPYEQRLWAPDHYSLFRTVFLGAPGSRKDVSDRFVMINRLRNRVFHFEPIWNDPLLLNKHGQIHDAIAWISPTFRMAITSVDRFPTVFRGREQIQARLERQLGLP